MRHSPFTTIYDACVLYPAPLRDLLVRLAGKGLYRARWSAQIDDEWKRNLLLKRRDLTRGQLDRISTLMEAAIPDALVVGHESLYPALNLPDPDDVNVLAAAIRSNAEVIVTFNLKDFPPSALRCFGVEAQHLTNSSWTCGTSIRLLFWRLWLKCGAAWFVCLTPPKPCWSAIRGKAYRRRQEFCATSPC